ncbi:tectonin beta-propeller repeat-containing protein 2-like [Saccoglossus kowalevskii]
MDDRGVAPAVLEPQSVIGKDVILKEFKPLSYLHNLLPHKAQKGIKNIDIELTCIDVNTNYIGLGSNIGLVFLFDRKHQQLVRLKCESGSHHITTVKLLSCLDDLVAAGTSNGHLCIFQLPSKLPGHHTELQKHSLDKLHDCAITCAEWSTNGMKLYTGDEKGRVIYTSVDFYQSPVCQSFQILTEGSRITQLSYFHKTLLVSTLQRSVLCYTEESNKLTQVGKKPRKSDGPFGACFIQEVCRASDATLYATRPGYRIWKAGMDGSVKQTYLLKELKSQVHPKIEFLSDTLVATRHRNDDQQFECVLLYNNEHLFTWSDNHLYVYDPSQQVIIGSIQDNIGSIVSIATSQDEIFLLRSNNVERPVIRIATKPETKLYRPHDQVVVDLSTVPSTHMIDSLTNAKVPAAAIDSVKKSVSQDDSRLHIGKVLSTLKLTRSRSSEDLQESGMHEMKLLSSKLLERIKLITSKNKDETDGFNVPKTQEFSVSEVMNATELPVLKTSDIDSVANDSSRAVEISKPDEVGPMKCSSGAALDLNEKTVVAQHDIAGESNALSERVPGSFSLTDNKNGDFTTKIQPIASTSGDIVFTPKKKKKKNAKTRDVSPHDVKELKRPDTISLSSTTSSASDHGGNTPTMDTPVFEQPAVSDTTYATETEVSESQIDTMTDKDVIGEAVVPTGETEVDSSAEIPENEEKGLESGSEVEDEDEAKEKLDEEGFVEEVNNDYQSVETLEPLESGSFTDSTQSTDNDEDIYATYAPESEQEQAVSDRTPPLSPLEQSCEKVTMEYMQFKVADSWVQCDIPKNITYMTSSDKHLWCVDNKDRVYHCLSTVSGNIKWSKLKDSAKEIAASPSENIVWCIHRKTNAAYASSESTRKTPIGSKWTKVLTDVAHVSLDDNMAWILKTNGDLYVQKGLSRDKPYLNRSARISNKQKLIQIVSVRHVVWGLTQDNRVIYRKGISQSIPEGTDWKVLDSDSDSRDEKQTYTSISLGGKNTAWAVDDKGGVWFRQGVTMVMPQGEDGKWWQVSMSDYLMQDTNMLESFLGFADIHKPMEMVTSFWKGPQANHITANNSSVWVAGAKNTLHVSRGNLLGNRWEISTPLGMAASARWLCVSATAANSRNGLVWALQPNGEVFCFPPSSRKPTPVIPPLNIMFSYISATPDAVWGLCCNGIIFIRGGMAEHCPQGVSWKPLDLSQLGSVHIISLSCGYDSVWACDTNGNIYFRMGVKPPQYAFLNPAWVPVEGKPQGIGTYFTQVFVGSSEKMRVWAIDNRSTVYARTGVSRKMPIGSRWEAVPGTPAIRLSISSDMVWAICPNGDVACRYGISDSNPIGDYWKKIPGNFSLISASPKNHLWSIDKEGRLFQRTTKTLLRCITSTPLRQSSISDDWEVL